MRTRRFITVALLALIYAVDLVALWLCIPERKGAALQ